MLRSNRPKVDSAHRAQAHALPDRPRPRALMIMRRARTRAVRKSMSGPGGPRSGKTSGAQPFDDSVDVHAGAVDAGEACGLLVEDHRSEERRVGKEGRCGW